MKTYQLNGEKLAAMIELSAKNLTKSADFINSLNVFPVPDGDTGTNMNLSMKSGAELVAKNDKSTVKTVSENLAKGLLMGARGNSGVILSQLFRGFAKSMESKVLLEGKDFAKAFGKGIETAYKAVMKPVEGTILTVAREAAKAGLKEAEKDSSIEQIMNQILEASKESLSKTPEQLPILKEAGVVDSGGYGLVLIYEGFYAALLGQLATPSRASSINEFVNTDHSHHVQNFMTTDEIKYGYCTEILLRLDKKTSPPKEFNEEIFRQNLNEMGDSLLVVSDDDIVKVHIHTERPNDVWNYGEKYGNLLKMKVENMREQHKTITNHKVKDSPEKKHFGIITISFGEGIKALFESISDVIVLSGGQTMNPSTEDIANAIQSANAEEIYVLPNNKNILMAAEQAASILSDEKVHVIPTTTIPEGFAAILAFHKDRTSADNIKAMKEAMQDITSGQITNAVRNTTVNGIQIQKGDYIGIINGEIKISMSDVEQATIATLTQALKEDSEIVTLIFGEEMTKESATIIEKKITAKFPSVEFEIQKGGQPIYPYIFSIE